MADTIQRDILTIYLEPNKPIRGTVARMDTLKLVITVRDADMNLVDLSDCRLVLTATDTVKTVFWNVYTVDAAGGVVAAEVQPDVAGRNEYRLKAVLSDTSEVTFFVGALAVAVENAEDGPAAAIESMTKRMLDAIDSVKDARGPQGEKGEKGEKGEVSQAEFDALANLVSGIGEVDLSGLEEAIALKADQAALDAAVAAALAPSEKVQALGNRSGALSISAADGNIVTLTVAGALSVTLASGAAAGFCRVLTLIMTNGGRYAVTWPTSVKWPGGMAPMLTSVKLSADIDAAAIADGIDVVNLITTDNGVSWLGMLCGSAFA